MLTTIQLNHQSALHACKVHDVMTDGMLTPEPHVTQLLGAKFLPEGTFRVSDIST